MRMMMGREVKSRDFFCYYYGFSRNDAGATLSIYTEYLFVTVLITNISLV